MISKHFFYPRGKLYTAVKCSAAATEKNEEQYS